MSEERVSYGPSMETVLTELGHRLEAARRHGAVPPGILEMLALIARAVEILDERTREGQRVVYEPTREEVWVASLVEAIERLPLEERKHPDLSKLDPEVV